MARRAPIPFTLDVQRDQAGNPVLYHFQLRPDPVTGKGNPCRFEDYAVAACFMDGLARGVVDQRCWGGRQAFAEGA